MQVASSSPKPSRLCSSWKGVHSVKACTYQNKGSRLHKLAASVAQLSWAQTACVAAGPAWPCGPQLCSGHSSWAKCFMATGPSTGNDIGCQVMSSFPAVAGLVNVTPASVPKSIGQGRALSPAAQTCKQLSRVDVARGFAFDCSSSQAEIVQTIEAQATSLTSRSQASSQPRLEP